MAQKDQKKHDKHRRTVNFKPFCTRRRIELLSNANDKIKDNDSVKFVYTDMHRTLKIVYTTTHLTKSSKTQICLQLQCSNRT